MRSVTLRKSKNKIGSRKKPSFEKLTQLKVGQACRFEEAFLADGGNLMVLFKLQALYMATDESSKCILITFISLECQRTNRFITKLPAVNWRNFPDFLFISLSNGKCFWEGKNHVFWQEISYNLFCKNISDIILLNAHMEHNSLKIDLTFCRKSATILQDRNSSSISHSWPCTQTLNRSPNIW